MSEANTPVFLDLMRHGEPVGGRYYRGQRDDPLSEKGWRQMWEAAGPRHPWDYIISSPLRRCAAFAQALGERAAISVRLDERLMEVGFGAWEGHTADELRAADPEGFRRFRDDPLHARPPGAEPLPDFYRRVSAAWEEVLAEPGGRHGLIVAHAGVIRAVLCHALDIPLGNMYRIQVRNAGLTRFSADGDGTVSLVFHGA